MNSKEHLTLDDRINLQGAIAKGLTISNTCKLIHSNRTTVYREIINNSKYIDAIKTCSRCKNISTCDERKSNCSNFVEKMCPKLNKFPYCCNCCERKNYCRHTKRYYDCLEANKKSQERLRESRVYQKLTSEQIKIVNDIFTECIKKNGQSLHHVFVSHEVLQQFCTEKTLRRYLYKGIFDAKPFHLPRFVRYKRKSPQIERKTKNIELLMGRTFSDFKEFLNDHREFNYWEYDSVEGKKTSKKAILTLTYAEFRFQFGLLINAHSATSVLNKLNKLKEKLGENFYEIFQINLSDNGTEFMRFPEIEFDKNGEKRINVFFTSPYKSCDKARCERNHEFIRYVIPKGKNFDYLTQKQVNLMFSHINSYCRESNQNKTPYQLMVERFGKELLDLLEIEYIAPNKVHLKEDLFYL